VAQSAGAAQELQGAQALALALAAGRVPGWTADLCWAAAWVAHLVKIPGAAAHQEWAQGWSANPVKIPGGAANLERAQGWSVGLDRVSRWVVHPGRVVRPQWARRWTAAWSRVAVYPAVTPDQNSQFHPHHLLHLLDDGRV
jgi:hypothetical protein